MLPYMTGGEKAGIYRTAFDYAYRDFAARDPARMAAGSGSAFDPERSVVILQAEAKYRRKLPRRTRIFFRL